MLSTQKKCKLGHFWFNYDNKHMRKQQELFSKIHDIFFVSDRQSPLGPSEKPSIDVHDHFLIQW